MSTLPQGPAPVRAVPPHTLALAPSAATLAMVCSPDEAKAQLQRLKAFVSSVLVEDHDYGKIAGVDRSTLLKPGAEKLAEIYGLAHRYRIIEAVRDWEKGFFYFEVACELTVRASGLFAGEAFASCNTRERRYVNRWATAKDVPAGVDLKSLKHEERPSKFNGGTYRVYLVENDDPYTLVNTVQKMAQKRALVAAVISVTRSSDIFTQDVEDLPAEAFADRDPKPANVSKGVASNAAPPAKVGPELLDVEQELRNTYGPAFPTVRTDKELDDLIFEIRQSRGASCSARFKAWLLEMEKQTRAAIGRQH